MTVRLQVQGVSKSFGATQALRGVELSARAGEVHAIVGENGAGKSTLMRVLSGEIQPDAGSVQVDGKAFAPEDPAHARALGVSIVNQELALCPHMTVVENIMLGRETSRWGWLDRTAMRSQAGACLDLVCGSSPAPRIDLDARVADLPMASRQLVEIARALVGRKHAQLLILDEPTSSLGKHDAEALFGVIRSLCAQGVTVLYVSHFLEEVCSIADVYTVLRDGATVDAGRICDTQPSLLVQKMVGRSIDQLFIRSSRTPGEVVLEVGDLRGVCKPTKASLVLRRGEVLGIAGLVGAGRTELIRCVFGLDAVKSGRIRLGQWMGPASPSQRLRQGMGMLSEDRKGEGLATNMSIADNLTLSSLASAPWKLLSLRSQREQTRRWMDRLGIKASHPDQLVGQLSGGNQQKVAMGRLLHHGVDVVLLDEPTRGVDVASKALIYQWIDQLACTGKAVLMVSSYLPELMGVCDRIQVMRRGMLCEPRAVQQCDAQVHLEQATGASE